MLEKKIDFNKYSSIRIGGSKTILIPQNINEALSLVNKNYSIIGKVNNLLIDPNAGHLMQLGEEFDYIRDNDKYIEIGAMCSTKKSILIL